MLLQNLPMLMKDKSMFWANSQILLTMHKLRCVDIFELSLFLYMNEL